MPHPSLGALASALPLPTMPRALGMVVALRVGSWPHLASTFLMLDQHCAGTRGWRRGCCSPGMPDPPGLPFTCSVLPIGQVWGNNHPPPLSHADPLQALVHAGDDVALPDVGVVGVIARVAAGREKPPVPSCRRPWRPNPHPCAPTCTPVPPGAKPGSNKQVFSFLAYFVPITTFSSSLSLQPAWGRRRHGGISPRGRFPPRT